MEITDKIRITNEDNMLLMARYPDNYFDLAIVDPPYGINANKMNMGLGAKSALSKTKFKGRLNSGGGKLKNNILNNSNFDWDNDIPSDDYFNELFRISKNQIICGGNYFGLPPTRCFLVWDKEQTFPNFSAAEYLWTSFDSPSKIFKRNNTLCEPGKIHPTQKPVKLYQWILNNYAKPGDKILDTHLGSGSIAIACAEYGFDLTACELDTEYYNKAIQRIQNHLLQQKLF
jgi:site-specific DNA-methyltransferase (adenine-specific)